VSSRREKGKRGNVLHILYLLLLEATAVERDSQRARAGGLF